ncbi:MAG: NUDIX hydrolase [Anaerovoracaceae bacterium]|jgi:8-oxo-dGTP pyrophosphatase MutT (NUDIX family)|nr:NUDIX hydrolase [Anaerovoracaceae bacterium]
MWVGGARVVVVNHKNEVLMVRHRQDDKNIWLVPGGKVEDQENSLEAAIREVKEETGLDVDIIQLIWHVEEVSPDRGQRFVNFFLGKLIGGELHLGSDPERGDSEQVMEEVMFVSREDMQDLDVLYPEYLKNELWEFLESKQTLPVTYKIRKNGGKR